MVKPWQLYEGLQLETKVDPKPDPIFQYVSLWSGKHCAFALLEVSNRKNRANRKKIFFI